MSRRRIIAVIAATALLTAGATAVATAIVVPNPDVAKVTLCVDDSTGAVSKPISTCSNTQQPLTIQSGWRYLGTWSGAASYRYGDVVSYLGGTYLALHDAGVLTPVADTASWVRLAGAPVAGPRGATGARGAVGAQGPAGARGPAGASGVVRWSSSDTFSYLGTQASTTKLARVRLDRQLYVSGTVRIFAPRYANGDTYTCVLKQQRLSRDGENFTRLATITLGPVEQWRGLPNPSLPGALPRTHWAETTIPMTTAGTGVVYLTCGFGATSVDLDITYRTAPIPA